jgi:L-amino acid N-acyltransferase YncA
MRRPIVDAVIRRATMNDARGVVDLINAIIDEGQLTAIYPTLTVKQEEAFIAGLGARSTMYLATAGDAVLGMMTIEPFAPYTRAMDHVAVVGTFVSRGHRRRGIGSKLFDTVLAFARREGYEKLIAYVRAGNAGGQAFYRARGFLPKMVLERQLKIEGRYDDEVWMEMFVPATSAAPEKVRVAVSVPAAPDLDPVVGAVSVRRAKRRDVDTLAAIMKGTMRWRKPPTKDEVLEMLFDKGYWLAMSRKGGGLTGWRAENLVMCIDDFYVYPPRYYVQVGGPLLETIETEARALACEVAIAFFDKRIAPQAIQFFEGEGYEQQVLRDLYPIWREVARELATDGRLMMVKPLREQRIMRPL